MISITSAPELKINTSDISLFDQVFQLTLTTHSKEDPSDNKTKSYNFEVKLIDNPCTGGFTNVPASSMLDSSYTAHTTSTPYTFTGVTNGSCIFSYEILNADLTAADAVLFTVTGLAFTPDAFASDTRIVNVTSDAVLTITGINANVGSFPLVLRLNSDKNIHDNAYQDVAFTVTIVPYPCN